MLSYYFIVVSYNILPYMGDLDLANQILMIIMLTFAVGILIVNVSTFWFAMWPIKYLLVIQSVQMSLMNFHTQRAGTVEENKESNQFENFMAMNVMISVFSTMFVIFNGMLISMMFQQHQRRLKYFLIAGIFAMNILSIVFTKFIIHKEMSTVAAITLILSIVYTFVLVTAFLWIIDFIQNENIKLVNEFEGQRHQFKSMFDSLQEGIVVLQDNRITFANELCSKILSAVSGMKSFVNNKQKVNEAPKIKNVDQKIFYVFNYTRAQNSKTTKVSRRKKAKKAHRRNTSSVSETSSHSEKTKYSLQEIADLPLDMLNSMIFTFHRSLLSDDVSKVITLETPVERLIEKLKCMRGVDEEFLPSFKFF